VTAEGNHVMCEANTIIFGVSALIRYSSGIRNEPTFLYVELCPACALSLEFDVMA